MPISGIEPQLFMAEEMQMTALSFSVGMNVDGQARQSVTSRKQEDALIAALKVKHERTHML